MMMKPYNPPHIAPFLGHVPEIDDRPFIAPTAAVVGAVRIGADSGIWYQVTVRGDNRRIARHYIELGRAHKYGTDGAPFHDMQSHPLPPR